ncbi:secreted alpha/beta hydrolase domain-containing protein [Phycomyces blakesleeanus]|uniref:Secreted alpha/beta hydrolase domain-containing protein n=1 Tax=Phycomyces blakesleeanus TaxID=4837 RepID=A0ABR3AQL7_PHYBL
MGIMKKLVAVSAFGFLSYAAFLLLLTFPTPQRMIIYCNWVQFPFRPKFSLPEYYGFGHNQVRNVRIKTSDNVTLGAWHILPSDYYRRQDIRYQNVTDTIYDDALADPSYSTVVYLHGNAMNRAAPWRVDLYKALTNRFGLVNLVTIDYRGFGDSDGVPSEEGLRSDAKATIDWLVQRNVPHGRITLIGHSLGTGVATTLAYDMTKAGTPPQALILKAAYSSLPNLIFEYRMLEIFPILGPLNYVPQLQNWVLSKLVHTFDSISRIQHIDCPVLIVYGGSDIEIPGHNSHQLFHRAIYGSDAPAPFTKHWLENDRMVKQQTIPNEATVYTSLERNPNARLVKLHHADHNNVGYYDYCYEAIAETAHWKQ